ncbi:phage tail protein [Novosphingobium resinovorum]|uniref:Tip attachment protein J domain-containing protein n=1 Tax=Novosphingobium resinovorum TaxID=158500 RepID=A0A1D8A3C6_9SPHN|nr:phage tail protein [Novosphingobium resinovorum]AOR76562.1 hypothetical protein BES08_07230 [Novosphingobium resinovorum]
MGGGKSGKMEVTDYYLSTHYRVCHGPTDALLGIYVGEKVAWEGEATSGQAIAISRPDLFGGNKKEGGVAGTAVYLPGHDDQVMPEELANRLGLTSATCPAYRGMSSVFFVGRQTALESPGGITGSVVSKLGYGARGFMWVSNNPYLKSIWMKMRRRPRGLDAALAMIPQASLSLTTDGNIVTVNGVADTVVQNTLTTINGHTINLNGRTITIDGVAITVVLDPDFTVTVGDVTYEMGDGVTKAGNYTVATPSSYVAGGVTIANLAVTLGTRLLDANPAHIIYECLTNTDWGQGGAPSGINVASFDAAALTLYNEGFGMSLKWTKQAKIEDFVSEILDHIQATLFVNPRDGLMTIKLIRGDYDINDLPLLTPDNCRVISFSRKAWGETANEIVVTWTNPENEQEETVAAQNNANIAVQGGIISDSRNYYGVRSQQLAQQLAYRDLATASAPIALYDIEVDRSAWDFVPGGCVRLHYPQYGIDDVVLRISDIDYGKPGTPAIKISTMEDIFALDSADYDLGDDTQWEDPANDPAAAAYARVITVPAFFASRQVGLSAAEYPSVYAAALVSHSNDDTTSYDLYGIGTLPNGEVVADLIGNRATIGHAILPYALVAEGATILETFGVTVGGPGPLPGGFVIIGNVAEGGHEIALIDAYDDATGWTLKRGVLDTVPRPWPDGTVAWFVSIESDFLIDSTVFSDGETARFRVSPYTSRGALPLEESPIIAAAMSGRPHLPSRPANVLVAGTAFGAVDLSGSVPATVSVTWANRNRRLEDSQVLGWTDGDVIPEDGQTTTVKLYSTAGDVLATHSGLTGTSFSIPAASWGDELVADVEVSSERDGLISLQANRVRVKIRPGGWGDDWGEEWGGGGSNDEPIGEPELPTPEDPDPGSSFPGLPAWKRDILNEQDPI